MTLIETGIRDVRNLISFKALVLFTDNKGGGRRQI